MARCGSGARFLTDTRCILFVLAVHVGASLALFPARSQHKAFAEALLPDHDGAYELVWHDEFLIPSGNASAIFPVNWTLWAAETGYIRNAEAQCYTTASNNLFVTATDLTTENSEFATAALLASDPPGMSDGKLVIQALHLDRSSDASCVANMADGPGKMNITSASISSRVAFRYGRIVASLRVPTGHNGTWPAFWLLGNTTANGWPWCGELDVMEQVGFNKDVNYATVHTEAASAWRGTDISRHTIIPNMSTRFVEYGVDWSPDTIRFFADNVTVSVVTRPSPLLNGGGAGRDASVYYTTPDACWWQGAWPFDNPLGFNIKLNLAIGGSWGGIHGVDMTMFPVRYEVDYVRVFQRRPPLEPRPCSPATLLIFVAVTYTLPSVGDESARDPSLETRRRPYEWLLADHPGPTVLRVANSSTSSSPRRRLSAALEASWWQPTTVVTMAGVANTTLTAANAAVQKRLVEEGRGSSSTQIALPLATVVAVFPISVGFDTDAPQQGDDDGGSQFSTITVGYLINASVNVTSLGLSMPEYDGLIAQLGGSYNAPNASWFPVADWSSALQNTAQLSGGAVEVVGVAMASSIAKLLPEADRASSNIPATALESQFSFRVGESCLAIDDIEDNNSSSPTNASASPMVTRRCEVSAVAFDFGGELVGYHDLTAWNENQPGPGSPLPRSPPDWVDVGHCPSTAPSAPNQLVPVVGYTYSSEWLTYTNVATAHIQQTVPFFDVRYPTRRSAHEGGRWHHADSGTNAIILEALVNAVTERNASMNVSLHYANGGTVPVPVVALATRMHAFARGATASGQLVTVAESLPGNWTDVGSQHFPLTDGWCSFTPSGAWIVPLADLLHQGIHFRLPSAAQAGDVVVGATHITLHVALMFTFVNGGVNILHVVTVGTSLTNAVAPPSSSSNPPASPAGISFAVIIASIAAAFLFSAAVAIFFAFRWKRRGSGTRGARPLAHGRTLLSRSSRTRNDIASPPKGLTAGSVYYTSARFFRGTRESQATKSGATEAMDHDDIAGDSGSTSTPVQQDAGVSVERASRSLLLHGVSQPSQAQMSQPQPAGGQDYYGTFAYREAAMRERMQRAEGKTGAKQHNCKTESSSSASVSGLLSEGETAPILSGFIGTHTTSGTAPMSSVDGGSVAPPVDFDEADSLNSLSRSGAAVGPKSK